MMMNTHEMAIPLFCWHRRFLGCISNLRYGDGAMAETEALPIMYPVEEVQLVNGKGQLFLVYWHFIVTSMQVKLLNLSIYTYIIVVFSAIPCL